MYYISNSSNSSSTPVAQTDASQSQEASSQATPPPAPEISIPADEQTFISTVSQYAANYKAAPNQMAQGAFRPQRAQAICALFPNGLSFTNWVGTISTLSSNNDGRGVLGISISPDTTVSTWNNAISDVQDNTLIQAGTALSQRVSALSIGAEVTFSGNFFSSQTDCLEEQSVTQDGSMTSPTFTSSFSNVEPYMASPTANTNSSTSNALAAAPSSAQSPTPLAAPAAAPDMQSATQPLPQPVLAFDQGHADRMSWENWISSLQGAELQGADYWAGQRSLTPPGTCEAGASAAYQNDDVDSATFTQGCQEAQQRIARSDTRRHSDPLYKAGWNAPLTSSAPAAPAPAQTSQ